MTSVPPGRTRCKGAATGLSLPLSGLRAQGQAGGALIAAAVWVALFSPLLPPAHAAAELKDATARGPLRHAANRPGDLHGAGMTIRDGLLRVNGSLASGRVDVVAPGALGGTGRVANLLLRDGGALRPGSSPGTLTVTNSTWSTNGVYEFEIMDFAGAYGATNGWDKLDVQGVLTVDAAANTFTVRVVSLDVAGAAGNASNFNPSLDYTLPIASVTGATALVGFNTNQFRVDASAFSNTDAGAWTVLQRGTNVVLQYSSATATAWDATNALAGAQDGFGVWSTTNANWWNGVSSQPWNSAAGRDAVFGSGGSGGQTVTVGEAVSAGGFVFNAGPVYTIGDTNAITLTRNATAEVAASSAVISAKLVGEASLTKIGTGTLTLVSNNTYSGGTILKAGALQIAQASSTPIARGPLQIGDTAGAASAKLIFANSITLTQAITVASGSTGLKFADSGGINPTLSGRLTLNDDFYWRLASAGNATFAAITLNARLFTVTNQSSGTLSFGGAISGAGGSIVLVNSGGGTITFGNNGGTFSGGTTVSGSGTLVPTTSSIGAGPTSGPFGTGPLNLAGTSMRSTTGGDVTLANAVSFAADMSFLSVASEKSLILTGPGTLTGNRTLTVSIGLNVAGKGLVVVGNIGDGGSGYGIVKAGSGNLILHGTNTYTGGTTINAGNVILASSNALALSTITNNVAQGLLFTNGTDFTIGGLSGTGALGLTNLAGGVVTLSVGNHGADTTYGGVLSGGGSLVKVGDGTFYPTAGQTYTGTTQIKSGVIATTNGDDRLPATTVLTLGDASGSSGKLRIGGNATARSQRLAGLLTAGAGLSNRVVNGASAGTSILHLDLAGGVNAFAGELGGPGANESALALRLSGPGLLALSGNNAYAGGTLLSNGTLRVQTGAGSGTGTGVVDVAAGTLEGTGRVARLLVRGTGTLSPGAAGVGQLTVTNLATWSTNGVYRFEVNDFTGAAGAGIGWDHQNVLGTQEVSLTTGSFTVRVVSLQHDGAAGLASNFNPTLDYLLPIASARSFSNVSPAPFVVDVSAFSNATTGEWSVVQQGTNLMLGYRCTNGAGSGVEWDATNTVAGRQDGSGTWSSTNANWWNGSGDTPWNNAARRTALLGAGGSGSATLTVAEPVTVRGLTLQPGPVYTVSGTGVVTFVSPSTVDVSAAAATLSVVLDGTSGWTKTGTGTVSLSGANLNSGGVRIEQGAVSAAVANALGSGGVTNNAVLHLTAGAVTYSGLSSSLRGSGTNRVTLGTGAGTTSLNGNYGSFTGEWYIGIGAAAGAGKAQLNGADHAAARIHVLTNSTVYVSGNVTKQAAITLYGGNLGEIYGQLRLDNSANWAGPVTLAGNMTAASDGHVGALASGSSLGYISGNIGETDGPRSLIKSGSDTASLVLRGTNTYRGGTVILNGFVVLGTPVAITNSTVTNLVADGLQFTNATAFTLGGLAGPAGFGLTNQSGGAVTLTVGLNGENAALSGVLRDAGGLIKVGTGTLTLSGANSFSGGLTIKDGTVSGTTSASALGGSGAGTVLLGDTSGGAHATLLGDGRTFVNPITVQAGNTGTNRIGNSASTSAAFTAPLTLNNALTLAAGGTGSLRLSGNITGSSTIQVFSAGGAFVHLNGTNLAFSGGVAIQTGLLRLDTTNALTVANPVFVNFGGTNDVRANLTLAGLADGADGGGTVVNGDTTDRTLTLAGSGSYAFSGDLSPVTASRIALVKAGTGTQTLSGGSSTYTRGTVVTGGTLRVINGAGSATGTGLVDVAVSGTLAGTGRVANLRLRSNGTLSPGAGGAGALTVTNGATWATNGVYVVEISDVAGAAGARIGWDQLAVGGALAVDLAAGVFTVRVVSVTHDGAPGLASNFNPTTDFTLPIASAAAVSGFDGTRFVVDTNGFANASSGTWTVVQSGSDVVLSYVSSVAADGFLWDATNSVAGAQDGRGTWSQVDTNWWNGTASVPWNNLAGRKARFGAAGTLGQYTVTLAEAISAGGIQFVTGTTYTILGDAATPLTLGNLSTVTVSAAHTATLATVLSGTNRWIKNGTGLLVLASNNTQRGQVVLDQGTLQIRADQTAALASLTIGVTDRSANAVTLNLSNASLTVGSLLVQHDHAAASTIRIGAGKTLSVTGHVSIGASDGTTALTINDTNGTFAVSRAGGIFSVGNGGDAIGTIDLGDLGTFTANLSTGGSFRVGAGTFLNSSRAWTMTLAATTTLTAAEIRVGAGPNGNRGTMTLRLGSGENVFNTDDLYVGMYANGGRTDQGTLMFDTSAGTFTLRGLAGGTSRADVHVEENNGGSTGAITDGLIDLRDHPVDLLIGALNIGLRSGGSGGSEAVFQFNSGVLDVNQVVIGQVPGSTSQNGTFDLQGGTVVINTNVTIGRSTGSSSGTSRMNVGGSASVTSALGVVVGHQSGGALTATLAISNSALLAVGGHLSSTGTVTSALILNGPGAVLDLNGKDIGDAAGAAIGSFTITTGLVRNVGTARSPITLASSNVLFAQLANEGLLTGLVSGAGALIKLETNTLSLSASNTYSGGTAIRAGTLSLAHGAGAGSGPITLGDTAGTTGATLRVTQSGTYTNPLVVVAGSTGAKFLSFATNGGGGMIYGGSLTANDDLTLTNMAGGVPVISLFATGTVAAGKTLTMAQMNAGSLMYVGGRLSGGGAVQTRGSGTAGWVFSSPNADYSGGTTLHGTSAQVVTVGANSSGPAGAPTSGPFGTGAVVLNGAGLRSTIAAVTTFGNPVLVSNDTTFATIASEHSLELSGPVTLAGDRTFTVNIGRNDAATALRISGAIGDGGGGYGLTVDQSTSAGDGRLVLSGSNTYSGLTRILAFGQLQLGDYGGSSGYLPVLSPITNDGRLAFGGGDAITQGVHFAGDIRGRGRLRRIGGGTVVLTGSNSFSGGISVETGLVQVVSSGALGNGPVTNLLVTARGALLLDGSAGGLSLAPDLHFQSSSSTNYVLRNVAGTNTVNGTLRLASGFGDSRIASLQGRLLWAGHVTNITGADRLLYLGGDSAESNTVSGAIYNGGGFPTRLSKDGTGTWVLAGFNAYTGTTTVLAGRLVVTTASTNRGGNYVVSGGRLGVRLSAGADQLDVGNTFTQETCELEFEGYETNRVVPALRAVTLAVNGTVTVYVPTNLVQVPEFAEYPLISYVSRSGAGDYVLGTVPGAGVAASIEDTGTSIVLRVNSSEPIVWNGDVSATWDTLVANWKQKTGGAPGRKFGKSAAVEFNDTLTANAHVTLGVNVQPGSLLFTNDLVAYSLGGTGRISGATALVKDGTNSVAILTTNDFTGGTLISGGVVSVTRLAGGGTNSALGRASASATNLVLAGGTLRYLGPAAVADRLFSVGTAGGAIEASGSGALNLNGAGPLGFNGQSGARTLTLGGTNRNANRLTAVLEDNGGPTSLHKTGPGTWWLQGANTQGGVTTVGEGVLAILADTALGTAAGGTVVSNGATLQLEGPLVLAEEPLTLAGAGADGVGALYSATDSNTVGGPVTLAGDARIVSATVGSLLHLSGTGALAGAGYTLTVAGAGDARIEGGIGPGAGGLNKAGAGRLTLHGLSTYAGGTVVSGGTLAVQGALNPTGTLRVAAGAELSGTGSVGAVTVNDEGRIAPGGGINALDVTGLQLDFGSQLAYEFEIHQSNDLIRVADAGGLVVNGGSFTLYEEGSTNRFDASGRYNLIRYVGSYAGDVAALSVSNPSSSKEYFFGAHNSNITLTIRTTIGWDGSGHDLPADNLRWTLNTNWADGYVPTNYDVFVFGAATKGHFNTNDMAPHTVAGGIVFLGDASDPYVLDALDDTHVLNLAGGITNLGPVEHIINIPLAIQDQDQVVAVVSNDLALNGVISDVGGSYGLTLAGAHTLTLTGTNRYGGTTRVGSGTLRVNNGGGSATGSGLADVFGTGTLGGTGRVSSLQVAAGGTLSPGAGGAAQLTAGTTTWGTNGVYRWEVNDFAGAHGDDPGRDRLLCTGVLTIAATAANAFTVQVTSLTYGNGSGVASNFVLVNGYTQILASASGVSGFDAARFRVETTNFHNPYAGVWSVELVGGTNLALVYSPQITNTLGTTNGLAEPAFEAGLQWTAPGHRNVQGNPAAPWKSYAVFFTVDGTTPTTNSPAVTFTNGPAALTNITTTGLALTNLSFDTEVRLAVASRDTLGRLGPLSAVVTQQTAGFALTQGLVAAESAVVLGWPARPAVDYDVIFQDAPSWADTLTNGWALLEHVAGPVAADTGSLARLPPLELAGGISRFYRVTRRDYWQTGRAVRTASREVFVARSLRLQPGENWVSLFATPEVATLAGIFGTNRLPAGGSPATATRVSWYGGGTSNGQPVATAYLSSLQRWVYSLGGAGVADTAAVALTEGFLVEVPGAAATNLVLGGWLTTNAQSTTVRGDNRFNLLSYPSPRRMRVRDLGLREAGFRAAAAYNQFTQPDELRVLNNTNGNGSATSPRLRVWLKVTASETNFYVVNGGLANNTLVEPDEVLIWWSRGVGDQTWTANPTNFYRSPTPQMTP